MLFADSGVSCRLCAPEIGLRAAWKTSSLPISRSSALGRRSGAGSGRRVLPPAATTPVQFSARSSGRWRLRSAVKHVWRRPAPPPGEDETGPEDDRRADAESRVKADLDRHNREMEASPNAETLQRQYDEPVHDQRRETEDEPAPPRSEKSREPGLEQGVGQS